MKRLFILFFLTFFLFSCKDKKALIKDFKSISTTQVNPFIGTGGHGHTYPGATVPFGMLQVSPVNGISAWDWCSGYHYSDSLAIGFSHLSLSGTGIGDLADVIFMPINKEVDLSVTPKKNRDSLNYKSKYSHKNETATPGYYQLYLEDHNVNVELTTSQRTAYHKYTFQKDDIQSVVIDLGFEINWDAATETSLNIEDPYTVSGYRFSTGWAKNQKVFFVAKFNKPITKSNLFADGVLMETNHANGAKVASQLFFDTESTNELRVKVALSSVSIDNAKDNLNTDDFDFEKVKTEANSTWKTL